MDEVVNLFSSWFLFTRLKKGRSPGQTTIINVLKELDMVPAIQSGCQLVPVVTRGTVKLLTEHVRQKVSYLFFSINLFILCICKIFPELKKDILHAQYLLNVKSMVLDLHVEPLGETLMQPKKLENSAWAITIRLPRHSNGSDIQLL